MENEQVEQLIVAPTNDFLSFVPEDYREQSYVQDIAKAEDPHKELWTKFTGMQEALKTQPAGMPSLDAPPEQWEQWANAVAPKDVAVYGDLKPQLGEDKAHLKEVLDQIYEPQAMSGILETARKVGVQPYQLKAIVDTFTNQQLATAEQFVAQQHSTVEDYNKEFDTICQQKFGMDREKIVREGFDFLAKVDASMAQRANNLPNEQLADLAALAYTLKQKYGKEDHISSQGSTASPTSGHDVNTLKATISQKMSSEEYRNGFHPGNTQAIKEVRALSEQLSRLTQPRKGY